MRRVKPNTTTASFGVACACFSCGFTQTRHPVVAVRKLKPTRVPRRFGSGSSVNSPSSKDSPTTISNASTHDSAIWDSRQATRLRMNATVRSGSPSWRSARAIVSLRGAGVQSQPGHGHSPHQRLPDIHRHRSFQGDHRAPPIGGAAHRGTCLGTSRWSSAGIVGEVQHVIRLVIGQMHLQQFDPFVERLRSRSPAARLSIAGSHATLAPGTVVSALFVRQSFHRKGLLLGLATRG
jgi:hypothetical protein